METKEIVKYLTSALILRPECLSLAYDRGLGEGMQIEKWLLTEILAKLIELRDKGEVDMVEGEHKFRNKTAPRFEHCDLWWQVDKQEHWLEVKTLALAGNKSRGKIQDVVDDLEKKTRLRATDIFHHLTFAFPVPYSESSRWINQIAEVYRNHRASQIEDWDFKIGSDKSLCLILASFHPTSDI